MQRRAARRGETRPSRVAGAPSALPRRRKPDRALRPACLARPVGRPSAGRRRRHRRRGTTPSPRLSIVPAPSRRSAWRLIAAPSIVGDGVAPWILAPQSLATAGGVKHPIRLDPSAGTRTKLPVAGFDVSEGASRHMDRTSERDRRHLVVAEPVRVDLLDQAVQGLRLARLDEERVRAEVVGLLQVALLP